MRGVVALPAMANPTTLRKTPEDEAKIAALRGVERFHFATETALWRAGLDALMEKHGATLSAPAPAAKTKAGPHPAKGTARKG